MARKIIRIDNYIGRWGYGKELLRYDLEDTLEEGVLLQISSFGGDVFHALDMYNQIAAHGNVEVVFTGPSASAATVLAMAAQKVSIVDNCFLLVHKVMAGVDNYGLFNEDELDTLISDLKTLQQENRQFDMAIAHIYAKRTGKSHQDMISQMKANTWITAEKALEMGFVDQVVEAGEKLNQVTDRWVAMVRDSELPPFPVATDPLAPAPPDSSGSSGENRNQTTMRQFPLINKTLETGSLESSEEGCYLNEEQLETIERSLEGASQCQYQYDTAMNSLEESRRVALELENTVESLTLERDNAVVERDSLQRELNSQNKASQEMDREFHLLTNALDEMDPTVQAAGNAAEKAEAIRRLLARIPGAAPLGILGKKDHHPNPEGVDWELINSLPHNRETDQNL